MLRRLSKRIALTLVSVCLALFFADAMLRLAVVEALVPQDEAAFQQTIAAKWPQPLNKVKPQGIYRIVGLADSFGEMGGAKNYHYLLSGTLESKALQVANFSRGAFNLAEEIQMLRTHGPAYQPDLVLHGVFVGNDFEMPNGSLVSLRGITLRDRGWIASLLPPLSLSWQWIRNMWTLRKDQQNRRTEGGPKGSFSQAEYLRLEYARLQICRRGGDMANNLRRVYPLLDQVRDAAGKMKAQYVIVIHPDQFQVEASLQAALAKTAGAPLKEGYDLEQPQRVLLAYCQEKGLRCLDLLPLLRSRGANGGLYRFRDSHYNEAGNAAVAAEVTKFLQVETVEKGL